MTIKIMWCGNSTALGLVPAKWGIATYYTANKPSAVAERILNARLGVQQCSIENVAIGGTTLAQWLNGAVVGGIVMPSWSQRMAATDASIVVVHVGINDAFIPGITNADFAAELAALCSITASYGKKLLFATDNPISYSAAHNTILWGLMNTARVNCPQVGVQVIDFNDAIARHVDTWPQFLADTIHPDETLYNFMGSLAATALARHVA